MEEQEAEQEAREEDAEVPTTTAPTEEKETSKTLLCPDCAIGRTHMCRFLYM